jgi:hypothetical protein
MPPDAGTARGHCGTSVGTREHDVANVSDEAIMDDKMRTAIRDEVSRQVQAELQRVSARLASHEMFSLHLVSVLDRHSMLSRRELATTLRRWIDRETPRLEPMTRQRLLGFIEMLKLTTLDPTPAEMRARIRVLPAPAVPRD